MNGYVAITDHDWYTHLRAKEDWEEVNFWQPSSHGLLNPPIGMPFFFKLRVKFGSPIVGFGHFAWRSKLPAWMAWDSFGQANGASDRAAMFERIGRLRREVVIDPTGAFEIGCLLISRPVFFEEHEWVRAPVDWPASTERGKMYNLQAGEGRRIYEECLARAAQYPHGVEVGAGTMVHRGEPGERFGRLHSVRPRLGQGGFRIAVADVYHRMCAISTEHSLPALDAAHIRPYAEQGEHDVRNGLFLRADIHRLFEQGFVTVTPEYRFLVSHRLKDDYDNGRVYYELQERIQQSGRIHLPDDPANYPDPALLQWHIQHKFVA